MNAQVVDRQDPARPIRVVAAEDSYVIREFLISTLEAAPEVDLVAVCSNRKELDRAIDTLASRRARHRHPDAAVRGRRGDRASPRACARPIPTSAWWCSASTPSPSTRSALLEPGSGGRAYLLKERIRNREELIGAIEAVARGGSVIDPRIVDVLIEARARADRIPLAELTPRERELLGEIAAGKSNGAIAESLVLTKRAVEKHVNSIFAKLGLGVPGSGIRGGLARPAVPEARHGDAGVRDDPAADPLR